MKHDSDASAREALEAAAAEHLRFEDWAICSGRSCKQGRAICKTPEKCNGQDKPAKTAGDPAAQMLGWAMIAALAVLVAAAAWVLR